MLQLPVSIKVNTVKEYKEIASELIMLGYGDDIEWNTDEVEDIESSRFSGLEFSVHIDRSGFFSILVIDNGAKATFENLEDFLNELNK